MGQVVVSGELLESVLIKTLDLGVKSRGQMGPILSQAVTQKSIKTLFS